MAVGKIVVPVLAVSRREFRTLKTFHASRRVEFRDTDAAGIVHFSSFFVYMEQAEHAFLRSLGLGVIGQVDGQEISWPRVNASCDYLQAIRFEDVIDIHLSVKRIGAKSVSYGFQFYHCDVLVAEGSLTAVCCRLAHGQAPESIAIAKPFSDALRPYSQ